MYTSETGYVGFAVQASGLGAWREPTDYMKVKSADINPDGDKLIPDVEIGSGVDITDVHQGVYKISGDIESYVRPEAIGVLFYGLLGRYQASGELNAGQGNYLHNFMPIVSGSLPYLSFKRGISDNAHVFHDKDCKIDSFSLELNAGEFASAKFGIIGASDAIGAAGTPVYETAPLLVATKATITIGGSVVSSKKLSLEINNNLVDDDYRIGSRFLGEIAEKRRELSCSIDVVLNPASALYQKSFYGAAASTEAGFDVYADSLDIVLDSPTKIGTSNTTYKILFSIKRAVFMSAPVPASGDDLVVVTLDLKPIKSGTNNIIDVKIWNGKASYSF